MVEVEVGMGRFSVDLMAQGDIQSLIYIDIKKG